MPKKTICLLPILAILALLPAVTGPLLLDDNLHLGPIIEWLSNRSGTWGLVFGNESGPFGRPLSIYTFMLNVQTTGPLIWPMKLTNLLLHLLTAWVLSRLFQRLFQRDGNLVANAKLAALAAALLWMVLPQHIATVFYVIQRMTILAALFSILACWTYVAARERIEKKQGDAISLLFLCAGLIFLSVMAKETGLLTPLYCLLIEWLYFNPVAGEKRPKLITWGFRIFVIYPGIAVLAYLALHPEFIMAGYIDRPFSMTERAATQISVLADYFISTFIPMVRSAGVYNDDFPISRGIDLESGMLLVVAAAIITAAVALRKKHPGFCAGIGIFLIGHLLESSIFSLEIYFVHRNYLPSIGLVLALASLLTGVISRPRKKMEPHLRILPWAYIGLILIYVIASYNRANLWSEQRTLLTHAVIHHPDSSRLRSDLLSNALYANRLDLALQQADIAMRSAPQNEKRAIQLWRILSYCYVGSPMPGSELNALERMTADRITLGTSTALEYVSAAAEANACPGLDRKRLGFMAGNWAVNTVQPPHSPRVWKTHIASARLLASSGDLMAGLKQADWAFTDSGYQFDPGILAFQLANSLEDRKKAKAVMAKLVANQSRYTSLQQSQLSSLRNP